MPLALRLTREPRLRYPMETDLFRVAVDGLGSMLRGQLGSRVSSAPGGEVFLGAARAVPRGARLATGHRLRACHLTSACCRRGTAGNRRMISLRGGTAAAPQQKRDALGSLAASTKGFPWQIL